MIDYSEFPLLEKDSSYNLTIPNYVKIYDILYKLISEGTIKTGDTIPSENVLASYWNVSRGTVRMAMRKLEEDGYINKAQGKQAVVATFALHSKDGIQWLYNPCLEDCVDTIDEIRTTARYQPCGIYIAHELGYEKPGALMIYANIDYFSSEHQVANTTAIFDAKYIYEYNLDLNNDEMIKQFIVSNIYKISKRSKTVFNVLKADNNSLIADTSKNEPIIIIEEVLTGDSDKQLAFLKHQLLASKYRFSLERKSHL